MSPTNLLQHLRHPRVGRVSRRAATDVAPALHHRRDVEFVLSHDAPVGGRGIRVNMDVRAPDVLGSVCGDLPRIPPEQPRVEGAPAGDDACGPERAIRE